MASTGRVCHPLPFPGYAEFNTTDSTDGSGTAACQAGRLRATAGCDPELHIR